MKRLIKKYFDNLVWFYSYLGTKIFIAVFLSFLVGALDSFGLTMFLPILKMVSGDTLADSDGMGKLSFIIEILEKSNLGITLLSVLLFMTFFFALKGLAKYFSEVYRVILQQRLISKIRLRLLNNLNNVSFKFFASSDVGQLQNNLTGEVEKVQQAYSLYFRAFELFFMILVYMGFAFFIDYKFAVLVTIGGALTNIIYKLVYAYTIGASKKLTDENNIFQGQIIQHVNNFKYLRATGMINIYANRIKNTIKSIEINRKKIEISNSILSSVHEPLLITIIAVVIFIQINVLKGSLGPIIISLLFFYRALTSLTQMQSFWNRFLGISGSINNLKSLQKNLKINQQNESGSSTFLFKKQISLNKVNFNYNSTKILKDINLTINKNKSIAFVGESGSGKTTLVNLISGLLKPLSGDILVDDKNIQELNIESFQKRIGYITQEPVIFNDTIFNNITFWSEKSKENLERYNYAVKKSNIYDVIEEMPLKEESLLGNNGINLSGGQKQRISIARELYKDIDIIIMDEATSSLDSKTERIIQENIDSLKGEYTILIVAHRLSTIKNVDQIVLLDNGNIIEKGTFNELIEKRPSFKKMVELQEI